MLPERVVGSSTVWETFGDMESTKTSAMGLDYVVSWQGLKVMEEIKKLKAENQRLKARVEKLERKSHGGRHAVRNNLLALSVGLLVAAVATGYFINMLGSMMTGMQGVLDLEGSEEQSKEQHAASAEAAEDRINAMNDKNDQAALSHVPEVKDTLDLTDKFLGMEEQHVSEEALDKKYNGPNGLQTFPSSN
jgi:hypothetical protein